jgi:hypothetical protein
VAAGIEAWHRQLGRERVESRGWREADELAARERRVHRERSYDFGERQLQWALDVHRDLPATAGELDADRPQPW